LLKALRRTLIYFGRDGLPQERVAGCQSLEL
jgi:hypothetical protein